MDKFDGVKWFEYRLTNAWFRPIDEIAVFQAGKCFAVCTVRKPNRQGRTQHTIAISSAAMDRIKSVLQDKRLYKIESLEAPYTPGSDIFDGRMHDFYFYNGEQTIQLHANNIVYCRGQYEKCPNAALVLDVLEELSNILVPELST